MLKGFYLTLYMGTITTEPAPRSLLDALVSAQVTETSGQRTAFQLVFNVPKNGEIERDLLPSGELNPLRRVQLVVTVGGTPTTLLDGLITRQDFSAGNTPGSTTLTLTGDDVSVAMDLMELPVAIPYPFCPPEARVLVICLKYSMYGLIPNVVPSFTFDIPIEKGSWPQQRGTDYSYVTSLAADAGYVFQVTPAADRGKNNAYWGPELRWGEPQRALSVNMDAHTNVDSLSFSYDGTQRKLLLVMAGIPIPPRAIPIPIPDVGILRPPMAKRSPIPFKFEVQEDTTKFGPIGAAGLALARAAQSTDAVTGNGTLNVLRYGGILKAHATVGVRGAGKTYDGTYYVSSVTHDIKRGEYKQSFSLVRGGVNSITDTVAV